MLGSETLTLAGVGLASAVVVVALAWWMRGRRREPEDVMIGFIGPSLAAVYLLVFALALASEWQTTSAASQAAVSEATATRELYWSATGLPSGPAAELRQRVLQYGAAVIAHDWPQMRRGAVDDRTGEMLADLTGYVLKIDPPDAATVSTQQAALGHIATMDSAREQRVDDAAARLPWGVRAAVIATSLIVTAFPFASGIRPAPASIAVAALQAALVTIGVVVVFQLDNPYSGPLAVGPGAMHSVVRDLTTQ